jgi:hypothetical protein
MAMASRRAEIAIKNQESRIKNQEPIYICREEQKPEWSSAVQCSAVQCNGKKE